ncbi:glycosyltransferase [Ruicaihuangia caeni]|uniref:Glycosyltransferase n=1 Tax=Ruicaihuangia caeni TaxID=3042517 RepID=A0AAW6T7C9_9MICO|nr:glycosyltransferase [Klugiella sp. YN-L-19]MDI2099434.1 glycosyltransferase [Klugiella sp. YN-L-19]
MSARVTAIVVARDGAKYLRRTLQALESQSRRPDAFIAVDAASSDDSGAILSESGAAQVIRVEGRPSFGAAVSAALRVAPASVPASSGASAVSALLPGAASTPAGPSGASTADDEWLWLLAHDNAPQPHALAALLSAIEVAPSVAVAGPKLMRFDDPGVISQWGETLTKYGTSVITVRDELDQGQHDTKSDVLGVAAGGMLVRRSVWASLGGFDPALPSADAALDFCVRARLAGFRVVGVPDARVLSAGGPELFGRRAVSGIAQHRIARTAQLHRRMVYAPAAALPIHWLSLLPLAILRSLGHLISKRPDFIPGEFAAALAVMFGGARVFPARRNLRRHRSAGWPAISPLRMTIAEKRELRAHERDRYERAIGTLRPHGAQEHPDFFTGGGAWVALLAAVAAVVAFGGFAASAALSGGGLAPLSVTPGELWSNTGVGWRDAGAGFIGAADPFAWVLAVFGSMAFWVPSTAIIAVTLLAMPVAAIGAWLVIARLSKRSWAPNVGALAWAFAPPLLTGLTQGHLGASIAHAVLPWLLLAGLLALRSWTAAGAAALLFAVVVACAPMLWPALLIAWVISMATRPRSIHRLAIAPIPALVLFAPYFMDHLRQGTPLAVFAEPGVPALPASGAIDSGWQLALGAPQLGLHGWSAIAAVLGFEGTPVAAVVVAALTAPIAVLALLAMFLRSARIALPALVLALLGYVTAVACSHVALVFVDGQPLTIWPGAGLSLYWLGITIAAAAALDAIRVAVAPAGLVSAISLMLLASPLIAAPHLGTAAVRGTDGSMLPAYVTAEAARDPELGTLLLRALPDSSGFAAELQRGAGASLDQRSTLAAASPVGRASDGDAAERAALIGELAANLSVPSGYDARPALDALKIGFVVLATPATGADSAAAISARPTAVAHGDATAQAAQALDQNDLFVAVGETRYGTLWRVVEPSTAPLELPDAGTRPLLVNIVVGTVIGLTLLLALPTGVRHRRIRRATDAEIVAASRRRRAEPDAEAVVGEPRDERSEPALVGANETRDRTATQGSSETLEEMPDARA